MSALFLRSASLLLIATLFCLVPTDDAHAQLSSWKSHSKCMEAAADTQRGIILAQATTWIRDTCLLDRAEQDGNTYRGFHTTIVCGYSDGSCHQGSIYFEDKGSYRNKACPQGTCPEKERVDPSSGSSYVAGGAGHAGGGGSPLAFHHGYNSNGNGLVGSKARGGMGVGRSHTYLRDVALVAGKTNGVAESWAFVTRPSGVSEHYRLLNGVWTPEAGIHSTLAATTDSQGAITGWTAIREDGDVETFDADGRLTTIVDRQGRTQTLTYGADDLLESVVDDAGREMVFTHDDMFHLVRVDLPDGRHLEFEYDDYNLVREVHADGTDTEYLYGETAWVSSSDTLKDTALTGIVDETGTRVATLKYNASHYVTQTFDAGNLDNRNFVYTVGSGYITKTVVTGALGETRTLDHIKINGLWLPWRVTEACTGCTSRVWSRTFDANGNPDVFTDRLGIQTDTDAGADGLPTQVKRAVGTAVQQIETLAWNTSLRLPTQVDRTGQRTSFTYNTRGQPLTATVTDLTVTPNVSRTSTYAWCEAADVTADTCPRVGLLRSVDGPRSDVTDVTTYAYRSTDDSACATAPTTCAYRNGDLWKVTDAAGLVTEIVAYDGAGRPLRIKDPNGIYSDTVYSPRGQVIAVKLRGIDDNTEADDAITAVEYFVHGKVKKITQPDGSSVTFAYDAAQRLTSVTDGLGNSIHYTLDAAGNRTLEEAKNNSSVVRQKLSRVFDALGQLAQAKNAAGQATLFTYDKNGALDLASDPLNRTADNDVDALGRLKQQIQDVGGIAAISQFAYDGRDNLTQVLDPKGLATDYAYNGFDEVNQLTSPDTGVTTYGYDAAGNLSSKQDARGTTMSLTYDALGRVLTQSVPASAQNATFAYDTAPADCAAGETFAAGRLSSMADESGSTRYCYDRHGNLVRKVQQVTLGSTLTTGATYNAAGQLVAMTYPSGAIVSYVRDGNGRISRVDAKPTATATQVTVVSGVTYEPFGPLAAMTFGNGRVQLRAYDQDYGIDAITESGGTGGFTGDYGLDAIGNVTSLTERTLAQRTFGYDGLDRIASATGGFATEGFTYDATGNRLTKAVAATTQNYAYPSTSHRLTSVDASVRTYDAMGNTLTMPESALAMTYDNRGRMREVRVNNALQRTYYYNAKGERVLRVHPTVSTSTLQFVYDEAGHLLGEYKADGTRNAEYVWMDDTLVAILKSHGGTTYQFVLTDHLGTPRAVVKPNTNTVVWRWDLTQTAFGDHSPDQDPDGDATIYSLALRYPGQYWDGIANVYYNYFRDYDAKTGRYAQSDPIGLDGGPSTFAYASSRPTSLVDPYGEAAFAPAAGWGAAGGGTAAGGALATGAVWVGGIGASAYLGWQIGGAISDGINCLRFGCAAQASKKERDDTYQDYKDLQRKGYRRDPNDYCQELRNKIEYFKTLIALRRAWDIANPHPKWPGGRHLGTNATDAAILKAAEDRYKEQCPDDCQ